jgi:hypothetical protein
MMQHAKVVEQTATAADGTVTVTKTTTFPDGTVTRTITTTTTAVQAQPIDISHAEAQHNTTIPVASATVAPPAEAIPLPLEEEAGNGVSDRDNNMIRGLSTGALACSIIGFVCFCIGWLYVNFLMIICFVMHVVAVILVSVALCTARTIADTPVKDKLVSSCVVNCVGALLALLAFFANSWLIIYGYGVCAVIGLIQYIQINNMFGGACCRDSCCRCRY